MAKILDIDIETTDSNPYAAGIHQISFVIEIHGEIKGRHSYNVRPHMASKITFESLRVSGKTLADVKKYRVSDQVFVEIFHLLKSFINESDPMDKFILRGYNVSAFDKPCLKRFWNQHDNSFSRWFHNIVKDSFILAGEYLEAKGISVTSHSQASVAKAMGIEIDASRLHDAEYDVEVSRKIYEIVKPKY